MRPMIAIVILAATALAGCGAGGGAADSSQVAQYVSPGTASATASPAASADSAPKCWTAADVKSAMGVDMHDLTNGMRKYGEFWNCGYVSVDQTALPGASVQLTVTSASQADETFADHTRTLRIARGPNAQLEPLQVGDRGITYDTPSNAVAAAVVGDRLYIVETMYGTAGRAFTDKKDATIALLRTRIP